ncbi:MAG: transposase [Halobacteriaceae archaeon]
MADNYGSHHATLTQERADELGIEFVFIPPYSPTLNAIEPLWKDLKREISPTIFEGKDHFREFVTETFLRLSHRLSFAVDWIETFLPDIQKLQRSLQRHFPEFSRYLRIRVGLESCEEPCRWRR